MKRLAVLLTAILVCLQAFSGSVVFGAMVYSDNIKILSCKVSKGDIYENYEFKLNLYCSNAFSQELKDVTVEVDPDCAFISSASSTIKAYESIPNGKNIYESFPINLIYKGKGDDLKLTFRYKANGNDYIEINMLTIKNVHPSYESPQQTVDTQKYAPELGVSGGIGITEANAGSMLDMTLPIKNSSSYSAHEITVTLVLEDQTKAPYILRDLDQKQSIDLLDGNQTKNLRFKLGILDTAPEGVYGIKLSFQCQNYFNNTFTSSETVYIKVKNEKPWLAVDNISVTTADPAQGGGINLGIKLKNLGNMPAKDVKVTLKGLKSGGYTTNNSTDVKYIPEIKGNETGAATYTLFVPSSGAASSNDLTVRLDYRDEMGNAYSDESQIFLPADGNDSGRPELAFENIRSPGAAIGPDQDFKLAFDLKNNGSGPARNILVSLTCDKEIVTKSLSNITLDRMDKGATKNIEFTLFATGDAMTKNYPLALNIQYEDIFGVKYTAVQNVGIFVENGSGKSVPRIIIDRYSFEPASVKAGEDFKLKLSFLNTSRTVNVQNVKVTVSSDDGAFTPTNSGNTFYIEDIAMKKSVGEEITLHAKPDAEQKSYTLTVGFDYEDDKGSPYTSKETVSIPITQNPRLVTGELSLPPETFAGQPLQLYLDFYNMGKSVLYNLAVKAEGDFQGQNLNYYVGNFESGRTDSYQAAIIPNAPGSLKGNIVFSFEDANGKQSQIKKEFSVNVTEMKQDMMPPGGGIVVGPNGEKMVVGPDGKMQNQGAVRKFNPIYAVAGVVVVVAALVTFILLRKRHNKRKEMSLDE